MKHLCEQLAHGNGLESTNVLTHVIISEEEDVVDADFDEEEIPDEDVHDEDEDQNSRRRSSRTETASLLSSKPDAILTILFLVFSRVSLWFCATTA